ncbi:V-type ATPase subunit, partial [Candidatus Micrarchaeota archaeon]|nr:V-type ATPase subunit [Candidatus Micrarchaeota archaeon]
SMLYFAGMIEKLGGMIPESDKKAFNLVLMKWDISNLKAVLNGRRYGEKYPDIAPFLVPVGSLKEEELSAILEGSGEAAFSAFIRSEIGRKLIENKLGSSAEIEKMFRGDLTSEGTMRIETALDALLYNGYVNMENELGAEFEPIVRVVRKEVDLKNALIVARLKKNGIDDARKIKSYLMKGGFKSIEYYDRIIELKSAEDVLKAIAADFDLKSVPSDLVELEVFIGKRLVKEKLKAFYRSVLSIGVVFGFLFLLEEESNNLRKITICKEFGVPEDKVSSMLVFPN